MKKLFAVSLIILLALCLLCGCNGNSDTQDNTALYYNLDKGAELTADANGVCSVRFLRGAEPVTLKVTGQDLLDRLATQDFVGLELKGDTVTGVTSMTWMPYKRLAWDYYVQSIGGTTLKLNAYKTLNGAELILKLTEELPVYDVTPLAPQPGAVTKLEKNDRITVIADMEDNIKWIYLTDRPAVLGAEKHPCPHCETDVYWFEWLSDTTLPIGSGHYMLTSDVSLITTATLSQGKLCLDLNGKTVTQTSHAKRIYNADSGGTLNILDSVGGGKLIPNRADNDKDGENNGMAIVSDSYDSVINLYSGTLDGSQSNSRCGTVIQTAGTLNMYGGEILGGDCYGNGGGAVRVSGTFNMYDGRIVGGNHYDSDYACAYVRGGGALRIFGNFNMHGGIIEGGKSWTHGGGVILAQNAKMTMTGGTITGCSSESRGGGVFVTDYATITLSSNAKITGNEGGNLWLDANAKLFVDSAGLSEGAQIGISMTEAGDFLTNAPAGSEKYFTSDDASRKIVSTGNGSWGLK